MASCGMLQPLRWMLVISEAHRIYARLRMPMLHMRIFIIIAIANTFTMRPLSLVGLKSLYSLLCILSKGNCIFGELHRNRYYL